MLLIKELNNEIIKELIAARQPNYQLSIMNYQLSISQSPDMNCFLSSSRKTQAA